MNDETLAPDLRRRIDRLTAAARAKPWSPEVDIDWSLATSRPWWLSRSMMRRLISELAVGEELTAAACDRQAAVAVDPAIADFLRQQALEETRHAQVYRRYLDCIGGFVPVDQTLARTFALFERDCGLAEHVLGLHVILEVEALHLQQALLERVPCPLLTAINRRVRSDEARHVAFGRLTAVALVAGHTGRERRHLHERMSTLWWHCADRQRRTFARYPAAILTGRFSRGWLRRRRLVVDARLREHGLGVTP